MNQHNILGYQVHCDKRDVQTLEYKLQGLPHRLRELTAGQYGAVYRSTFANYTATVGDTNPVIEHLAAREARNNANNYLKGVLAHVKAYTGQDGYLTTVERLKLQYLMLWEQHAPDSLLLDKERAGSLDDASANALRQQRLARRKATKAFLAEENLPYPGGTNDSKDGNGSRHNRLVSDAWLKNALRARLGRSTEERARCAGRVGKHADLYLTEESYQQYLQGKADAMAYMENTVFISHEDDEVEMLDVYNSTTANPRNRKTQLITQVAGMVKFAEKYGYTFVMVTPTAASEHHPAPRKKPDASVIDRYNPDVLNPKYNPKWTVKKTHGHLNAIAERVFSALDREGVEFYGFKGIEAHKDGTPHHHYGFFYKDVPGNRRKVHATFAWYFQELDQIAKQFGDGQGYYKQRRKMPAKQRAAIKQHLHDTQPGAAKQRVTFVYPDSSLGSLSNYILKSLLNYVIKDVADIGADGKAVELTPKQQANIGRQQRVAAWASLNGIRQFTTLRTGASIGVYQELRRIHAPVEGSTQLEQERLACVGSYGTDQHGGADTRVNADFCRYMELRRNPLDGAEAVGLWKVTETESDNITIKFNEYSDEVGRVQGVRCHEDGALLEINTRPIRWRAVNVPMLVDDLANSAMPNAGDVGSVVDAGYREATTKLWADIVATAREQKTLHELARGMYHYPISPKVGIAFRDRAKPVTTWKIRNNPTVLPDRAKTNQTRQGGGYAHPPA